MHPCSTATQNVKIMEFFQTMVTLKMSSLSLVNIHFTIPAMAKTSELQFYNLKHLFDVLYGHGNVNMDVSVCQLFIGMSKCAFYLLQLASVSRHTDKFKPML